MVTRDRRALAAAQTAFRARGYRHTPVDATAVLVAAGAVLAAICLWTADCSAETSPSPRVCAPEFEGTRRATVTVDGQVGVWFAAPVARCILADLEELPHVRVRVTLLEERLTLRDEQVERLRRAVGLAAEEAQTAADALETAVRLRREAEDSARVWWRSPVLWFAVGVVVSAGLVALTAYALSSVSGP